MKKLLALVACAAVFLTGCDETPSAEVVNALSTTLGASAAAVVKLVGVDADTVANINEVLTQVDRVVPDKDQSFTDAWTSLVEEAIAKLKEKGKLDDTKAKLVSKALEAAMKGLDRLFEMKPKWKQYDDVVTGAISGFIVGFQGTLAPAETGITLKGVAADPAEVKIIAERCGVSVK